MNKFNTILLLIILVLITAGATAQEAKYKIIGNEIVSISAPKQAPGKAIKTKLTHTIKGIKFPVYQSANNKYYILRVSKKTNKEYKQYLKL